MSSTSSLHQISLHKPYKLLFPESSTDGNSRVSLDAKRRGYTLTEAVTYVAKNWSTVIVCAVSQPYLPFLNNWFISIVRQQYHEKVLVIADDYATLYTINGRWSGHVVLIPLAPDAQVAHKFGSQMSTAMESMKMKLFAAVVVMLMAVSAVSNVAAQEAPAPAPGPASAASVYVPAALISLLSLSFGFLF
ncbi:hypothetical protein L2E82_28613 [Cichorium intybus]|uniref:Uncharacterized protein n=1 Tax=Cichorium intybus TaxID=13427 RepID=A0ACB9CWH5_CICIN|nr:hypothetical protein L2E82_28613 [Cichorium intybus]